jgi:c-di-GMP-binding flagellar brake protein YcgR
MKQPPQDESSHPERRQYLRVKKNFIMTYHLASEPAVQYKITQLKNISKGGMCFITAQRYEPSTSLMIELRTPYLADVTLLKGNVLQSHEKLPDIIYETRLKFEDLSPQAELLLDKLEEFFKKGVHNKHE